MSRKLISARYAETENSRVLSLVNNLCVSTLNSQLDYNYLVAFRLRLVRVDRLGEAVNTNLYRLCQNAFDNLKDV